MAKRLNKKLVAALTAIAMVAMMAVSITLIWQLRTTDPSVFVRQAEEKAENKEYPQALKLYVQAFKVSRPQEPQYLVEAGRMALEADRAEDALVFWRKAMEVDDHCKEAQKEIVDLRLDIALIQRSTGLWTGLRDAARRLLEIDENSATGHYALGVSLVALRAQDAANYTEGVAALEKALELEPDNATYADAVAGHYIYQANQPRRVVAQARQGVAVDPPELRKAEQQIALFDEKADSIFKSLISINEAKLESAPDQEARKEASSAVATAYRSYSTFLGRRAALTGADAEALRQTGHEADATSRDQERDALKERQLSLLEKAVELAPDDPDNHVALGIYEIDRGDIDKAKKSFEKAIEVAPDSFAGYRALGEMYRRSDPPDPDKAIQVYDARLKRPTERGGILGRRNRVARFGLLRDTVETVLDKIRVVERQATPAEPETGGQEATPPEDATADLLAQAEQYLERAVSELGGETAYTHKLRGKILRLRGRNKEAINEFEAADTGFAAPDGEVKWSLAQLYYEEQESGAAYKATEQALQARPTFAPGWALLARLELDRGNPQQALQFADKALRLEPPPRIKREILVVKAESYRLQGEVAQAERLVQQMMEIGKEQDQTTDLLRMALLKIGEDPPKYEEAEKLYLRALKADPANVRIIWRLIDLYQSTDREADAQALVEKALADKPDDKRLQLLALRLGEKDKAKLDAALLEAIEQDEDPLAKALSLYRFYARRASAEDDPNARRETFGEALKHLLEAEALRPDDRGIVEKVFQLSLLVKDFERATAYANKAADLNLDGANGDFYFGHLALVKEDYDGAIEKLRSALKKHPADSLAYVWLGIALEQQEHRDEALEVYRKAIDCNPNNSQAHLALAKLAERMQDEDLLGRELAECQRLKIEGDPWLKTKLQEKLEEEKPLEGIAKREALREQKPDDVNNLLRLVELSTTLARQLGAQGNLQDARSYMDKADQYAREALAANPNNPFVVHKVASLWTRANKAEQAEQLIKDLIDRSTEPEAKSRAQLLLAMHYRSLAPKDAEKLALADEAYESAAATHVSSSLCREIANWYLGTCTSGDGREVRIPKAIGWFKKAIELNDDPGRDASLRRETLEAALATRDPEQIQPAIDDYRKRYPDDAEGIRYQAQYDIQRGELDEALREFTVYLEREPEDPYGYYRRGMVYFRQSRFDAAATDLRRAKSLAPTAYGFQHRIQLARALELSGEPARGVTELRGIIEEFTPEKFRNNPAMLGQLNSVASELSDMLGRQQRWAEQEALIVQFMNRFPKNADWAMRRGRNGEAQNDLHKALTGYHKAAELTNLGLEPTDQMLKVLNDLGQYSQVVEFVRNTLPPDRMNPFALLRLAHALLALGKQDEALAGYDKALSMASRSFVLFRRVAMDMQEKLGADAIIANCRKRIAESPDSQMFQFLLATSLAIKEPANGEAQSIFQKLYEAADSDSAKYVMLQPLASIAYARKEFEHAKSLYEEILKIAPNDLPALNNLAYLLASDLNRPAEAIPYAERAVEMLPDDARVLDTLGWASVLLGKCHDGISVLSKAAELAPNLLPANYHLAKAYICTNDRTAAERQLRRAKQLVEQENNQEYRDLVSHAMAEIGMAY